MSDIHRLLDEAFSGVSMTPELQDLKEELRGNLIARVDELQSKGAGSEKAAAEAVAELDIPQLIAGIESDAGRASGRGATSPGAAAAELARLNRVRPRPAFVVAASVLSVGLAACVLHVVVDLITQSRGDSTPDAQLWTVGFGILLAALVAVSLHQETSTRYPLPLVRSIRWGLASGFLGTGIGYIVVFHWHPAELGLIAAGIILALAGMMAMIALGVAQTNRMKPWALAQQRQYESEDRFSQDPVAAARFGIYTVVIWIAAIALFVVLSITVGFVWSWLALVAGVLVFFLVLNRMLFGANAQATRTK
jgi:hypothetical protein